jgi:hypothetical protein
MVVFRSCFGIYLEHHNILSRDDNKGREVSRCMRTPALPHGSHHQRVRWRVVAPQRGEARCVVGITPVVLMDDAAR